MENDKEAAKRTIDALKAKSPALAPKPGKVPSAIEGVIIYRQLYETGFAPLVQPRYIGYSMKKRNKEG
jgi:hypothetical protein